MMEDSTAHRDTSPSHRGVTTKRPGMALQKHMKSMFQMSWSQRGHDIYIVFVRKSPLLDFEKFDVALTDCSCTIKPAGGPPSGWVFFLEVKAKEAQRIQNVERLIIVIPKKDPTLCWPNLKKQVEPEQGDLLPPLVSTDEPVEPPPEKIEKKDNENQEGTQMEMNESNEIEKDMPIDSVTQSPNVTMAADSSPEISPIKPQHNSRSHDLSWVKNDWYEMGADVIVFTLYVPHLDPWCTNVTFAEDCMQISFKTADEKFHNQHGTSLDVLLSWNVKLNGKIVPSKCSHNVSLKLMEIKVIKEEAVKWTEFLAPSMKSEDNSLPIQCTETDQLSSGDNSAMITDGDAASTSKRSSTSPNATIRPVWTKPTIAARHPSVELGYTGLDNLGNTCFMNSVLQALANTRELREYFLEKRYVEDINIDNPLGMSGKMAKEFSNVMQKLWSGFSSSFASSKFRLTVGEKEPRFIDYMQHDAQEFMAFLLDKLHEDLNRIKLKPYYEIPEVEGREDHLVAEESWKLHTSRNDSFIVDLFHGMFKSKLICPQCQKNSIKFDPFLFLSVPLPKATRTISLYFFSKDITSLPIKLNVSIAKSGGRVIEVLRQLAEAASCDVEGLRMFEVYRNRIHRFFLENSDTDKIMPSDIIFVFETLSPKETKEPVYEIIVQQRLTFPDISPACYYCKKVPTDAKTKRCTKCERTAYCDQECQRADWPQHKKICKKYREFVGLPFIASVPQSQATYTGVKSLLVDQASQSVDLEVFFNSKKDEMETIEDVPLQLNNMNWNGSITSDLPLLEDFDPEESLDLSRYKLIALDWETDVRLPHFIKVTPRALHYDHGQTITSTSEANLYDCIRLFTEPEVLAPQEAWYCPKCKDHQEATKEMSLWQLPDILIVQLKRFSFKNYLWRDKIDMFVDFPVNGLDMSQYCINKHPDDMLLYDLFAVVNHHGGIFGGHYTSYVRLPKLDDTMQSTVDWRVCDDSHVMKIAEQQVVTKHAYVMFYQKRKTSHMTSKNLPQEVHVKVEKDEMDASRRRSSGSETSDIAGTSDARSPSLHAAKKEPFWPENGTEAIHKEGMFRPIKPEKTGGFPVGMPPLIREEKAENTQNNSDPSLQVEKHLRSTLTLRSETSSDTSVESDSLTEQTDLSACDNDSANQSTAMDCYTDQSLIKYDEVFSEKENPDGSLPDTAPSESGSHKGAENTNSRLPPGEPGFCYTDMDAVD